METLYAEAQHLEALGLELAKRESSLSEAHRDAADAAAALRDLEAQGGAGGGTQTLVPLGLGAYAKATVPPGSKIVVSIGAGAAVEKDARSALNFIEARIKEIEVVLQDTSTRRAEVAGRFEQVRRHLGGMAQQAAQAQAQPAAAAPAAARAAPRPEERA